VREKQALLAIARNALAVYAFTISYKKIIGQGASLPPLAKIASK
jgi:hypothetical protein